MERKTGVNEQQIKRKEGLVLGIIVIIGFSLDNKAKRYFLKIQVLPSKIVKHSFILVLLPFLLTRLL